MNTIDTNAEWAASEDFWRAENAYRATKGWFSCDSLCQRNKQKMNDARYRLDQIRAEGNARMSDAKSVAGLFSEVGVGEVKDSFWSYFSRGKQFAKRQSMWDAMFMGMRSMGRDEKFFEYALKVLMVSSKLGICSRPFVWRKSTHGTLYSQSHSICMILFRHYSKYSSTFRWDWSWLSSCLSSVYGPL